jgi:hypothetical protein
MIAFVRLISQQIFNRLLRLTADSTDLPAIIKQAGKV